MFFLVYTPRLFLALTQWFETPTLLGIDARSKYLEP